MKKKVIKKSSNKLTPKRKLFVKHYLSNGFNATQAAISAGYSKKTANEQGSRLLTNVSIKKVIKDNEKKTSEKFDLKTKDIINELIEIGINKLITKESLLKYSDKLKALELLGRYKGIWLDKLEVTKKEYNINLT